MKAITIWQPWATLIAIGAKRYETRSWSTTYRGPLAIHAAKRKIGGVPFEDSPIMMEVGDYQVVRKNVRAAGSKIRSEGDFLRTPALPWEDDEFIYDWPIRYGAVIAVVEIESIGYTENVPVEERVLGDFTPGRFAWKLANVQPISPVPAQGSQRLWNWEPA